MQMTVTASNAAAMRWLVATPLLAANALLAPAAGNFFRQEGLNQSRQLI